MGSTDYDNCNAVTAFLTAAGQVVELMSRALAEAGTQLKADKGVSLQWDKPALQVLVNKVGGLAAWPGGLVPCCGLVL